MLSRGSTGHGNLATSGSLSGMNTTTTSSAIGLHLGVIRWDAARSPAWILRVRRCRSDGADARWASVLMLHGNVLREGRCQHGESTWILWSGQVKLRHTGQLRRRVAPPVCGFFVNARESRGEPIMTRTLRGSLLIASMLVVTWATSSEACHRRRACAPATSCYGGYNYAGPTGYYGAGGGYGMAGGGYYGGGYAGGTATASPATASPATASPAPGTTSAGPATTRAASAGRRPGWGCGPAWASAASARGADRPQVLRSPRGACRPGPTGPLGAVSAAAN